MLPAPRTLAILVAIVVASSASILVVHAALNGLSSGSGTDYGLDTNGNGKYDWLVVEADVSLPATGPWSLSATLSASAAPVTGSCGLRAVPMPMATVSTSVQAAATYPIAWAYERYFFTSGPQTVRVAFNGSEIYRAGVDGPYSVDLQMYLGDYPILYGRPGSALASYPQPSPTDLVQVTSTYTTRAYAVSDFDEPFRPAYFTGASRDAGVDLDADGLYDLLTVTADIHVAVAGNYSVSGNLWRAPASTTEPSIGLGYAYAQASLSLGDGSVSVAFRGDTIRAANLDGPYNFSLTLYGPMPPPYIENGTVPPVVYEGTNSPAFVPWPAYYPETLCGATSAYRASAFDAVSEIALFTGAFQEVTPDWDRDGLFDALTVRAEVRVYANSAFTLGGVLHTADGATFVASTNMTTWLPEGTVWAEWTFAGYDIASSGLDGPYLATLSLQPGPVGLDPTINYTTAAYRAVSFDMDQACYNCTVTSP